MAQSFNGVNIGIAADAAAFDKAVERNVIQPLENAEEQLARLDRAGDMRSTERGMRDAQDATKRFERELDDVVDQLKKSGRQGRDMGDEVERGMDSAEHAVREFKDEAKANLSETVSSFDGSMESLADGLQGTLGGLAANLGPAGIAGAAILAAVVGVAGQAVIAWQENLGEIEQSFADMYAAAAEEGRNYLTEAEMIAEAQRLLADPEKQKELRRDAETLGVKMADIARAQAGDQEVMNSLLEIAKQKTDDIAAGKIEAGTRTEYELRDLGSVVGRYEQIQEKLEQQRSVGAEQVALVNARKAAEEQAAQAGLDGIRRQGEQLAALAGQPVTAKVRLDTKEYDDFARKVAAGVTISTKLRMVEKAVLP